MKPLFQRLFSIGLGIALIAVPLALPLASQAQTVTNSFNPGDLIKGSLSTVYYFAPNGKRLVFPNEKTYFTWYSDFSTVKTISDTALAAIPLGGNVTYRPGVKLVKITTDPKTYAVDRGGTLRWVTSEQLAAQLYGTNWAHQVDDIPDAFFVNYTRGTDILSVNDFSPSNVTTQTTTIAQDKSIPTNTASVNIVDINTGFVPQITTVKVGTTVTWTNNDPFNNHTVTSNTGVFDSGVLAPTKTFSFTFPTAGSFSYHCSIHPGMQGTINVVNQ
ncbi:MAG TPA: cupredoxin domain-containing protein [Patescibacteria group bacterium]|nr:cupredoxin domain-containing protein [Patescibacteria group bacterium]